MIVLGFVQGCNNEDEQIRGMLSGRWELARAFRNEKATETLSGTYFVFTDEGKMETNLPVGADAPVPFDLKNKVIEQQTPQAIRYCIKELSASSMVLSLELRGINFEMYLKRAATPTTPAEEKAVLSDSLPADYKDSIPIAQ
jgi:hypothetical protein